MPDNGIDIHDFIDIFNKLRSLHHSKLYNYIYITYIVGALEFV